MLKEQQQRIAAYFESHGIPVTTRYIRGGLSIYTKARKIPITRFVATGSGDSVEVMWYSHRERWDHIGDFGGMTMPLEEALEYVASDAPGCSVLISLRWKGTVYDRQAESPQSHAARLRHRCRAHRRILPNTSERGVLPGLTGTGSGPLPQAPLAPCKG